MTPEEFWDLEPKELTYAFAGWQKEREETLQGEWERTRWLATTLVNLQVKKPIKAKDLIEFPWDKPVVRDIPPPPTAEQIEAMAKKFGVSAEPPDPEKLKAFKEKLDRQLAGKK